MWHRQAIWLVNTNHVINQLSMLGSQRKLVHVPNSVRRIQKSWCRVLKTGRRKWRRRKRRKNEKCSVRDENWHTYQIRYDEFKNRGVETRKPAEESEEEEKEEKTKNARIATKIGAKIKFGTANSKIVVPDLKNKGSTTPTPHPFKMKKCSVRNENWYQDQIWYDEFKNCGPES